MKSKRKLTENMAISLAKIFKLTKPQTEYLLQLIRYAHSKTYEEKQYQFERLIAMRHRFVKKVEPEQYRFYEKWFYTVVR